MQVHSHGKTAAASPEFRAQVLIVGAGPVGLTMAADLSARGVSVLVAETRGFKEPPNVKCNHVSARTMEQFRRLGFVDRIRNAGLPPEWSNDIAFRVSSTGPELARVHIPGRTERYEDKSGPDGWWPTPEPAHRINQLFLEPLLAENAAAQPHVTLLNRVRVDGFEEVAGQVIARATDLDTDEAVVLHCQYLVGCDGARSMVRKGIGASLSGDAEIHKVQSTYIRATGLRERIEGRPAWCYYSFNHRRCGTLFAIDGRETWLIHNPLKPGIEPDFDAVDRDAGIRAILGVERDFAYEVISKEDWIARRLVADRLRKGRVFIAGDAAHLWIPQAGYGMNAGIADALDLSWMLAARLEGWAGDAILDAYEVERLPITDQVSRLAMNHGLQKNRMRDALPPQLEQPGPEGEAARSTLGQQAYELNVRQFCAAGLNFGYYYSDSPLIVYDGEAQPAYTMDGYTPSTVPGCRVPHFWRRDGSSLYDALGTYYSLLRRDATIDVRPLEDAARERGVPLKVVDIGQDEVPDAYRHQLFIVRPDQHVAWRGDGAPARPLELLDHLRGAAPTTN
ncbi:MAG TPA: FAD-dependent oxidoreductase [Ramlibacter sp.]|jgi:2-polyprenyl-6-methoxyphenol hydroxylase-like FAD-dependent oxidoreductase